MIPGRDRRYNDRDVRDNPELEEVARDYLNQYTGEFDFLLGMQMRVEEDRDLTTGMVRGVLNCMRNDPRATIPVIEEANDFEEDAVVIPIRRKAKHERRAPVEQFEPDKCRYMGQEHDSHWYPSNRGGRAHCIGWHALRRNTTTTRARFHAPFIRGRNSNLIHRSTHEGTIKWWPPNFHQPGQATPDWWHVKPVCPLPGLKQPDLLDRDGVLAAEKRDPLKTPAVKGERIGEVFLCPKCFPGTGP